MKRISLFFLLSMIFLISCGGKKKYKYKEDLSEEKIIEAYSDSAAYIQAYEIFIISKKSYTEIKNQFGGNGLTEPISFSLYNDKGEDIRYSISFSNKDSLDKAIEKRINSLPNNISESVSRIREEKNGKDAKYDTGGLYLSPIKVLKAKFVEKEYSNFKDISLNFKNVSNKRVSAIRFKWYGVNAFDEPADVGSLNNGWGGGFDDDELGIGKTRNSTWSVLSKDGKKILIAYPYEVAFIDGTKWELNK